MSKYDSLRQWNLVKARKAWSCDGCGESISPQTEYWAESIGGGVSTIGLKLGKLCQRCYRQRGGS